MSFITEPDCYQKFYCLVKEKIETLQGIIKVGCSMDLTSMGAVSSFSSSSREEDGSAVFSATAVYSPSPEKVL